LARFSPEHDHHDPAEKRHGPSDVLAWLQPFSEGVAGIPKDVYQLLG
jgi:hypothetical protein